MAAGYIPGGDGAFDAWQRNFGDYVTEHFLELGLTVEEVTRLKDAKLPWEAAYETHGAARAAAKAARIAKVERRADYERVIRELGLGPEEMARRLREEGVRVQGLRVTPLIRYFTADFRTEKPLERLRREQEEIASRVKLRPLPPDISRVAGVDAAYLDSEGIGICVVCDREGEPLDYVEVRREIRFPYIPTYLSYRELPLYLPAVKEAEEKGLSADVILVDGNGILHPRRVGIATHLGVLLNQPTVGVAKKLLCGEVNPEGMAIGEWRPVVLDGETVGAAMRTARNRTIFISPGHLADVRSAVDLVASLLKEAPLPEPLRWAHELATEARRAG